MGSLKECAGRSEKFDRFCIKMRIDQEANEFLIERSMLMKGYCEAERMDDLRSEVGEQIAENRKSIDCSS